MKWLVALLLLVNIALLGYFQLGQQLPAEAVSGRQDIDPARLRIINAQELANMPSREKQQPAEAVTSPPAAPVCYEWGSFPPNDASRALEALHRLGLDATAKLHTPQEAIRYWVYIPPRKSMEEAQAKVDELKALNVEESFIVQEPRWQFAISLGVFKEEALATKYLEELRNRGIQTAIKGQRNHEGGQTGYFIRNVQPAQAEEISKFRPDFPGSELKQVDCL